MPADEEVRHEVLPPADHGLARAARNVELIATLRTLDGGASLLGIVAPGPTRFTKARQLEVAQPDAEIVQEPIEVAVIVKLAGELGIHDGTDHHLSSFDRCG